MDIGGAFANSCNGVFAQLAAELGADTMTGYVEQAGLLSRYSVDGIQTAQGSYNLTGATQGQLGWSGVGQYNDLVNPCAMMVWMGAVANGGRLPCPTSSRRWTGAAPALPPLRKGDGDPDPVRHGPDPGRHDGPERGPDLRLRPVPQHGHLRQVGHRRGGGDKRPNAWFVGFLRNEDAPYAFAVVVEEGAAAPARRAMWPPRC